MTVLGDGGLDPGVPVVVVDDVTDRKLLPNKVTIYFESLRSYSGLL